MVTVQRLTAELSHQLEQATAAPAWLCDQVAHRLMQEIEQICQQSPQIQTAEAAESWAATLKNHRQHQCLRYYQLGSHQGRIQLHERLGAIAYRHVAPPSQSELTYTQRWQLTEESLRRFYLEALNALRREHQLASNYAPRLRLELAEYLAFCERYGKRRILLPNQRSQRLIVLQAQAFCRQKFPSSPIEGKPNGDQNTVPADRLIQQIRTLLTQSQRLTNSEQRDNLTQELLDYLEQQQQTACANYLVLRCQDLPPQEIAEILQLTPQQCEQLQQQLAVQLIRFSLAHQWEFVRDWLDVDLDHRLGLSHPEWQQLQQQLTADQQYLLARKQAGDNCGAIAQAVGWNPSHTQKQWFDLLAIAWEIRNCSVS